MPSTSKTSNSFFVRKILALSALPLAAGCAHPITTHLPANRFDSPEATGVRFKGDLAGGLEGGNQWDITPDLDQNPPNFSNPGFDTSQADAVMTGDLGLLDRLDVGLKIRFDTTSLAELKYQILGNPRVTAKEGNFSLAITAAGGTGTRDENNQTSLVDAGVVADDTITETDLDFALIGGYRPSDLALIYGGPAFTRRLYSGSITQTVNSAGSVIYPFNGNIDQFAFNVGMMAGGEKTPIFARIEYAAAWTWSAGITGFGGYWGGEVGFTW